MRSSKMFKAITSFALVAAMVAPAIAVSPATADAAAKFSTSSALLATGTTKSVSVKGAAKKSKFKWASSNKKVATVKGKKNKATITAKGAGTAKITCKVTKGKKTSTVSGLTIKVRQKITSFAMQDTGNKACTEKTLKINETLELKGAINNNASGSTTNQTVTWSSTDTKVATVKKKNANVAVVTAKSAGKATIIAKVAPKSKTESKEVTCTITVSNAVAPTPTPTPKPTNTPLPAGYVYKQKYEVTRWYEKGSNKGHSYSGYKYDNFAIWMVGFFDNEFSTNEDAYMAYGPDLTKVTNAELKEYDFRKGKELTVKGDFSYEGDAQKTILFQINYTSPSDYPILWKWEDGAEKAGQNNYQKELKVKNNSGKDYGNKALKPNETGNLNISFTIPSNAQNGDKDEEGKPYGIYLYFPNKPDGALAYKKNNTFHFKNFQITY